MEQNFQDPEIRVAQFRPLDALLRKARFRMVLVNG